MLKKYPILLSLFFSIFLVFSGCLASKYDNDENKNREASQNFTLIRSPFSPCGENAILPLKSGRVLILNQLDKYAFKTFQPSKYYSYQDSILEYNIRDMRFSSLNTASEAERFAIFRLINSQLLKNGVNSYQVKYTNNNNIKRINYDITYLTDGRLLITGGNLINSQTPHPGPGLSTLASVQLYNPVNDRYIQARNMLSPRYMHTATVLKNGKVLIVGGMRDSQVLSTAEVFDPGTNNFVEAGSLKFGLWGHATTLLNDGRVLITSGRGSEIYIPEKGIFVKGPDMKFIHVFHTATLLKNGQVLIVGGKDPDNEMLGTDEVEIYDPKVNKFFPFPHLNIKRFGHSAILLVDGKVLILGGYSHPTDAGDPVCQSEVLTLPKKSSKN